MSDKDIEPAKDVVEGPADYHKMWGLSYDDDYLIFSTTDFAIWLDIAGDLDWRTSDELDKRLDHKIHTEINRVFNRSAILQSYPVNHLTKPSQRNFRIMVGEGLARAFEFDPKCAMEMFDKAAEFAVARNQEIARVWYLLATGTTTLLATATLFALWSYRPQLEVLLSANSATMLTCTCAGALGSFFSILTRVGRTPLDPAAGKLLHWLEGIGRILIGVVGAAIALAAIKAGFILTILADKGTAGLLLVAMVAGASERLVPSIIKRVELDSVKPEEE